MSWVLLALAGILLAILQRKWAPAVLRQLTLKGKTDKLLVQPDEKVTWRVTLENRGRLPVLFARLQMHFPEKTAFPAPRQWVQKHCVQTLFHWHVEEKFVLMPNRSTGREVVFSLPDRGMYSVGDYRLSSGDLLGFHEVGKDGTGTHVVVMPKPAKTQRLLQVVGGFLGDISVRRFTMEDPVLTVGFREYTGREPMKAISWSRTAVTGTLQVKQYDHTAEQTIMVLLDTEGGTPEQLEGCFRLARTVCEELENKKIPYGLRTNGSLPGPVSKLFSLAEGLGEGHLNTVLYALGRADYACYHSAMSLTRQTLRCRKKNESYILITPSYQTEKYRCIHLLQEAAGNSICVLTGEEEVSLQ